MSHYQITRRMKASVVIASWSGSDGTVATNSPIPFDSAGDLLGSAASSVSITSNAITLPTGYWWWIKGSPQVYSDQGWIRYAWRDSTTNTQYGRSGFLTVQKTLHAFGGDELATALIDCTSAPVTVTLNIEGSSVTSDINDSNTTHNYLSGRVRALLWRLG